MNLHGIVRGAINAVNPDKTVLWRESTGATTSAAGVQTPTYADHPGVTANVQALTGRDLQHRDMMNVQGVVCAAYLFGDVQGVIRPEAKGGDLLVFPRNVGGPDKVWKVVAVLETWTPDAAGWCKVGLVMQ